MSSEAFGAYASALVSLPISHVWRGHGSALFLEIGRLTSTPGLRRDGSHKAPRGDYGVMIEWSWRIEDETSILCGSDGEEEAWPGIFQSLVGRTIEKVSLVGRLPELSIALSGDRYVVSFMTAGGQPQWVIFDQRGRSDDEGASAWISVDQGQVRETLEAVSRRRGQGRTDAEP